MKSYYKKGLILGIIFLLFGASISVSAIQTNIKNNLKKENNNIIDKKVITEKKQSYIIGGINITLPAGTDNVPEIEWWKAEDRNFTYKIENGMVKVYCYLELRIKVDYFFFIPWLVVEFLSLRHRCQDEDIMLDWDIGGKIVFCDPKPFKKSLYLESYDIIPPPLECNMFDVWIFGNAIHNLNQWSHSNYFNFWATFE
jgi:hypothetical protein